MDSTWLTQEIWLYVQMKLVELAFMCAPEYIGQLLSLLWLNRTFSNRANLGASYPKSYHY
jgi:hypothetical protein